MKKAIQISYGEDAIKVVEQLERMGIVKTGGPSRFEMNKSKFTKFGTIIIEFIEE